MLLIQQGMPRIKAKITVVTEQGVINIIGPILSAH